MAKDIASRKKTSKRIEGVKRSAQKRKAIPTGEKGEKARKKRVQTEKRRTWGK